jgi:hypothetical protein
MKPFNLAIENDMPSRIRRAGADCEHLHSEETRPKLEEA